MKKLLKKIVILFILVSTVMSLFYLVGYYVIGNQYEQYYTASIIDKVNRLKLINEPKIIMVGNSNLSFGIDSELLEKEMNMPVVNLGLHGGLGNAFHEEMSKRGIKKDDIVLVSYTEFSDDDKIDDTELAWKTIEYHYDLWNIIRKQDWYEMIKAYPNYLYNTFVYYICRNGNLDDGTCYSRNAFNEYGDIVRRTGENMSFSEFSNYKIVLPTINDRFIERCNLYNDYIEKRGAKLLIIGYPILKNGSTPNQDSFANFTKELRSKVKCEVISDFSDYFFDYDYFYNSYLHLNKEGAELRTSLLIQDLKNWLNSNAEYNIN